MVNAISETILDLEVRGVAGVAVLALAIAGAGWVWHKRELADAVAQKAAEKAASEAIPPTTEGIRLKLGQCQRSGDLACQERLWVALVNQMPSDGAAHAQLGMVMNRRSEYALGVEQMHQAIDMGVGGYDLFALYADGLAHLGRTDDAIDWSYKSLSLVPRLVDVRGSLATLLVGQLRPYEALSLLEGFDRGNAHAGQSDYFGGQRIAIEASLADTNGTDAPAGASVESSALRLPVYERHFYVPVVLGHARPAAFMIDTGATLVTLDADALKAAAPNIQQEPRSVQLMTADGRQLELHPFRIDSLRVGPYELHDVEAVACAGCQPLLGQSGLSRFDLQSSRHQGVEFLTLTPRSHS
jgi:clan AA aspartic protease (TIGR02281 family)